MLAPAATLAEPVPPPADRQLELLDRLAEVGLEIALTLERQAKAAAPEERAGDPSVDLQAVALAYSRVARAVRLTILLRSKLADAGDMPEVDPVDDAQEAAEGRKLRIERVVRRIVQAETDDEEKIERLLDEATDRLDEDDCYGDVMMRPVSEIVADICRDLGLDPDWSRLAQEAWAREEVRSGEAGWPLASALPRDGEAVGSGGDGPASMRPQGHPHPRPFPPRGGREPPPPS